MSESDDTVPQSVALRSNIAWYLPKPYAIKLLSVFQQIEAIQKDTDGEQAQVASSTDSDHRISAEMAKGGAGKYPP